MRTINAIPKLQERAVLEGGAALKNMNCHLTSNKCTILFTVCVHETEEMSIVTDDKLCGIEKWPYI